MSEAPEFTPLTVEELQVFFPQYEILSFIAAGGMGAVYLANQKSIDRRVAIKVLPREMSNNDEFSSQFKAEAKVMSKLNHPNLIGFFDFGAVDGMLFIVMEFVDGKSLHHSAHGEAIEQDTALELALGIAEGVNHAHSSGILHRDIKPANVLLDQNAFPKLGDFGLARPVEESELGKVIYGTPGYTAPEVIDNPESIDERSDIYSVGAILYELLTGHLPQEKYLPPSRVRNIDPAFDKVTQKAIAFDPDLRYANMGEFLKDLKKIKLFHERGHIAPTATAPISAPKQNPDVPVATIQTDTKPPQHQSPAHSSAATKKKSSLKPLPFLAAGIILLLLLGLGVSSFLGKNNSSPPAETSLPPSTPSSTVPPPHKKTLPTEEEEEEIYVKEDISPLESLEALADPLSEGDLSTLPESTRVHGLSHRAFFLYPVPRDWHTAQLIAENYGGYLACADSSEIRAFLLDQLTEKEPSVWLGGGTAGDTGLAWVNGKKWNFPNTEKMHEGYVSMSNNGFIKCESAEEEKPFFICWNLEGLQEGQLTQQFFRLRTSAQSEAPILPPGAVMTNKSIYVIQVKYMDWKEAFLAAKKYNASLAVPNDSVEDTFLSSLILNGIEEGKGAWMGGEVNAQGEVNWGKPRESLTKERWITPPSPGAENRGVLYINGDTLGWQAASKTRKAAGAILEWRREEISAPEVTEEPEEELQIIPEGYVLELLGKAKVANAAKKESMEESLLENIDDGKAAVSKWIKAQPETLSEDVLDEISAYFIKAEDKGRLTAPDSDSKFPIDAQEELSPFLKEQNEIETAYKLELLKLKTAMVERILLKAEEEDEQEDASPLKKTAKEIKKLKADSFQEFLDQ